MPAEDPAALERARRPYHPRFVPRLARDDTPGAPFAGFWLAAVPRPDEPGARAAGAAYFADLADARAWALAAWRAAHRLPPDAFCVLDPVAQYTVDPQDPDAAARWERTTGAALREAGTSVILRRFTDPAPARVPGPRPPRREDPRPDDALADAAWAAEGAASLHDAGPEDRIARWRQDQAARRELAAWRDRLVEAGALPADAPADPDAVRAALLAVREAQPDLAA